MTRRVRWQVPSASPTPLLPPSGAQPTSSTLVTFPKRSPPLGSHHFPCFSPGAPWPLSLPCFPAVMRAGCPQVAWGFQPCCLPNAGEPLVLSAGVRLAGPSASRCVVPRGCSRLRPDRRERPRGPYSVRSALPAQPVARSSPELPLPCSASHILPPCLLPRCRFARLFVLKRVPLRGWLLSPLPR